MTTENKEEMPPEMLDELWNIMHLVTEMAVDEDGDFDFECDGVLSEEEVECEKAAKKLAQLGDAFNISDGAPSKSKDIDVSDKDMDQLVEDISSYILAKANEIEETHGCVLGSVRPDQMLFNTGGMLSSVYGYFQSQVSSFLGVDQSVNKIALVGRISKGVVNSTRDSSSETVNLISAISFQFVKDSYGSYIKESGGLKKIAEAL